MNNLRKFSKSDVFDKISSRYYSYVAYLSRKTIHSIYSSFCNF